MAKPIPTSNTIAVEIVYETIRMAFSFMQDKFRSSTIWMVFKGRKRIFHVRGRESIFYKSEKDDYSKDD